MLSALALISLNRYNKNKYLGQSELSRNTILACVVDERSEKSAEMVSGRRRYPDSHENLIITFWPFYNVLWNLHASLFRGTVFALSRQIKKQKACENN